MPTFSLHLLLIDYSPLRHLYLRAELTIPAPDQNRQWAQCVLTNAQNATIYIYHTLGRNRNWIKLQAPKKSTILFVCGRRKYKAVLGRPSVMTLSHLSHSLRQLFTVSILAIIVSFTHRILGRRSELTWNKLYENRNYYKLMQLYRCIVQPLITYHNETDKLITFNFNKSICVREAFFFHHTPQHVFIVWHEDRRSTPGPPIRYMVLYQT